MKKNISLLLVIILFISCMQVFAAQPSKYVVLTKPAEVVVVEVIDAECLLVKVKATNEYAYIKMIGNDSMAYDEAYQFVSGKLLGATVFVVPDSYIRSPIDKWNQMYVYLDNVNFNDLLVKEGYVKADNLYSDAIAYSKIAQNNEDAKDKNKGIWNKYPNTYYVSSNSYPNYSYPSATVPTSSNPYGLTAQININTATASQLATYLTDVSSALAARIVSYRNTYGYFNHISQIMRVSGFTQALYDKNKSQMVVCTNIATATREELMLLKNVTASEAQNIVDYRAKFGITNINTLYDQGLLSRTKFEDNKRFISVVYVEYLDGATLFTQVNINTATAAQLNEYLADVSRSLAQRVVSYRTYNNPFTNIQQIKNVDGFTSDIFETNKYIMVVKTNILTALLEELMMLGLTESEAEDIIDYRNAYGIPTINTLYQKGLISKDKFDEIKDYITVSSSDYSTTAQININTATATQLSDAMVGISYEMALKIVNYRATYGYFRQLSELYNISGFTNQMYEENRNYLVVCTNIAVASKEELLYLGLTDSEAQAIVDYRDINGISKISDIIDNNLISQESYNRIRNYIAVGIVNYLTIVPESTVIAVVSVNISSDTPNIGTQLTAVVSPANATNVRYQWYSATSKIALDAASGWTTISGATSTVYTPTTADAGKYLKVVATGDNGSAGAMTANAVAAIVASVPITGVSVTPGTPTVGTAITATVAPTNATNVTYQWYRADTDINENATSGWTAVAGATSATSATYTPVPADVGKYLKVVATGDSNSVRAAKLSGQVAAVVIPVPITGVSVAPAGTPTVGTAITATVTPTNATNITYQWYRADTDLDVNATSGWTAVAGATSTTYTPVPADVGKYLKVVATGDSNSVRAAKLGGQVAAVVTPVPITGVSVAPAGTPTVGTAITATVAPTNATNVTYQWYRADTDLDVNATSGWTAVAGATSTTYMPVPADVGKYLKVVATGDSNSVRAAKLSGQVAAAVTSIPITSISVTSGTPIVGTAVNVTVVPSNATGVTYQWYRADTDLNVNATSGWTAVTGATNAQYTPVLLDDAGKYLKVVVTGDSNAEVAKLSNSVVAPITSISVDFDPPIAGVAVTASVAPSNDTNIVYEWYRSNDGITWAVISGANSAAYTPVYSDDANKFLKVTASGDNSSTRSFEFINRVAVMVTSVAVNSNSPVEGTTLTATVTPTDATNVTYQWYSATTNINVGDPGWDEILGETSATYTPTSSDINNYLKVAVSGVNNSTESYKPNDPVAPFVRLVSLTSVTLPSIQPVLNVPVTAQVTPSDATVLSYQWYSTTDDISQGNTVWTPITGATSAIYTPTEFDVYLKVEAIGHNGRVSDQSQQGVTVEQGYYGIQYNLANVKKPSDITAKVEQAGELDITFLADPSEIYRLPANVKILNKKGQSLNSQISLDYDSSTGKLNISSVSQDLYIHVNGVPIKVILASGSLGTAGDKKITGLTPGGSYKVEVGTGSSVTIMYADSNGKLSTDSNKLAPLTGSTIGTDTNPLTNGTTYKVILTP